MARNPKNNGNRAKKVSSRKTKEEPEVEIRTVEPEEIVLLEKEVRKWKNKALKAEAGESIIAACVRDIWKAPPKFTIPQYKPTKSKQVPRVAILHISDTQIGKITTSYDTGIAEERLAIQLPAKVIGYLNAAKKMFPVDEMRIYLGGDIVEGELIFPGQSHETDSNVLHQATMTAPTMLAKMIQKFLGHVHKIKVVSVPGNHGRASKLHSKDTNWDRVTANTLEYMLCGWEGERSELYKQGRIEFDNPQDKWYAIDYVGNWGNLIAHGHQIRGWAGIPFYGVMRKVTGWADSIWEPWDNLWIGHFHTPATFSVNHRKVFMNGTSESDNEYAAEELAACGWAHQRLVFAHPERGIEADHDIWLEKRTPQRKRYEHWNMDKLGKYDA